MVDFYKMTRDFIVNEGQSPSVVSYVQSLSEILANIKPNSVSEQRRLEIAKENLNNIRRHVRRMEEKISFLEEEMKILQEKQATTVEE